MGVNLDWFGDGRNISRLSIRSVAFCLREVYPVAFHSARRELWSLEMAKEYATVFDSGLLQKTNGPQPSIAIGRCGRSVFVVASVSVTSQSPTQFELGTRHLNANQLSFSAGW